VETWWTQYFGGGAAPGEAGPGIAPGEEGIGFGSAIAVGRHTAPPGATPWYSIAVGAPGHDRLSTSGARLADVGTVVSLDDFSEVEFLFEGLDAVPPNGLGGTYLEPARLCGSGTELCEDSRFGAAVAQGRFLEDAEREERWDLAVGAPGSPGINGNVLRSGHVEVRIPNFSTGWDSFDASGGDLFLDSSIEAVTTLGWGVLPPDYAPEVEDHYGSALHGADILRTMKAEADQGHYKDELIIGAPGEALGDFSLGPNHHPGAGMACVVLFGDTDLDPFVSSGTVHGVNAAPVHQHCFGLNSNEHTPLAGLGAADDAAFGSSLAAGPVSPWDSGWQLVVGAPGDPSSSDPAVAQGRTHVLYVESIYNSHLDFQVPRVHSFGPQGAGIAVPARFGTAVALFDYDCGGAPDIVVGATGIPGANEWGAAVVTKTEATAQVDPDWSGFYAWDDGSAGPFSEETRLVLAFLRTTSGPNGGGGYLYTASPTNHHLAMGLDVEDGEGNPIFSACSSVPWNVSALPGGMVLDAPEFCDSNGDPVESAHFSSTGTKWTGFDRPRPWTIEEWTGFATVDWKLELTTLVDQTSAPEEFQADEFEVRFFLEPLGAPPPVDPARVCSELTALVYNSPGPDTDLTTFLNLNGESLPNCSDPATMVPDSTSWTFTRMDALDCRAPWKD